MVLNKMGYVISVADGVALVGGLQNVGSGELVKFQNGEFGLVLTLTNEYVSVVILGSDLEIEPSHFVARLETSIKIKVRRSACGQVLNSLGQPVSSVDHISALESYLTNKEEWWLEEDSSSLSGIESAEDILGSYDLESLPENSRFMGGSIQYLEAPAPSICDRVKIESPLQTGLIVVDAVLPIGKGQRELIVGDRQLGKTAIAIDAILSQSLLSNE